MNEDNFSYIDIVCDNITACGKVWFDKIYDNLLTPTVTRTADYSDSSARMYPNKVGIMAPILGYGPPSHIIDNIFLGSAFNAASKIELQKYNIRFVLNITAEISNYFEDNKSFGYQKFALYDNNKESIAQYLQDTFNVIKSCKEKGGNILVHCFAGRSRSASIVAYYIMMEKGVSPREAFDIILEKRPIINPTKKFVDDLEIIFNEALNRTNTQEPIKEHCYEDDIVVYTDNNDYLDQE